MTADSGRHPTAELDETVHQRVRLGILAILSEADKATFTYLRNALEVTDGNLSTHVAVLAKAGPGLRFNEHIEADGTHRFRPRLQAWA